VPHSQFSRLLAAEVCASAVVMLDKPCSEEVWRVLAAHSIRQFPLHFPSRASTRAITFQLDFTTASKDCAEFTVPLRSNVHITVRLLASLGAHSWRVKTQSGWTLRFKQLHNMK